MGMESYFIQVLPIGVMPIKKDGCNDFDGHSSITYRELFDNLRISTSIQKKSETSIIIDNALILSVDAEGDYVISITIEGCFAWYSEGLKLCFTTIQSIDSIIENITIFHPGGLHFGLGNENEFIQKIMSYYQPKYDEFTEQFGGIQMKVLPGSPFYDAYMKNKRKSIWTKIFTKK